MKAKSILVTLLIVLYPFTESIAQHTGFAGIAGLNKYTFEPLEKKTLPGKSQETAKNGDINASDIIGKLGLVSLYYQNACYTDGRYNHNDFAIEKGLITDEKNSIELEAYCIYEPSHKASEFLASQHTICYRFDTKQDYSVYLFESNNFNKIGNVLAKEINTARYTKINNLTVSNIKGSSIFVFVPANTIFSVYNKINPDIEGAMINKSTFCDIYKLRYSVKASPFDNVLNNYSENRHYFSFAMDGGKTGIIWQENENLSLHLSIIEQNINKIQTLDLPNPNNGFLAAAAGNNTGDAFYLTINEENAAPVDVTVCKYNLKTGIYLKNKLDVSKQGLNMYKFGKETASLGISGKKLLLMIARTMHKSNDGLNHQGGIAVLFNAENLEQLKNYGQTSGHSFDNFLMVDSSGGFIGMDLGDNYPRGINVHRFGDYMQSKVVYTFKTRHGETADCWGIKTYPSYPEISTSSKKYYKWSNDNATYTELGSIVETKDGYLVSFLGEPDKDGYALNNSEIGNICSKNVGFVKVNKNLSAIVSKGISEKGGFYTFGGNWAEQKNEGIVWLTKYLDPDKETSKFLKTIRLEDGKFLFLWELWSGSKYQKTLAQRTDEDGNSLGQQIDLGNNVRMDRRDDLLVKGNQVLLFSGNPLDKKLEMTVIEIKELKE